MREPGGARQVFISYRRADSGYAGHLHEGLSAELGEAVVFRDIDALTPGVSFVDQLMQAVDRSAAMLVVISPGWITAADADGNRRLDNPDDYVRREIAMALERHVPVIPVLVGNAKMPAADALPDEVRTLAELHASELYDRHWRADLTQLADVLRQRLAAARTHAADHHAATASNGMSPAVRDPAALDDRLLALIHSPLPSGRLEAVDELIRVMRSPDRATALAARQALDEMIDDDSRRVAARARDALNQSSPVRPRMRSPPAPRRKAEPRLGADWSAAAQDVRVLERDAGRLMAMAFARDASQIASGIHAVQGQEVSVMLWNVASGRQLCSLIGARGSISAVAFSPDGSRLAAADAKNKVRLWDVASGRRVRSLKGHTATVRAVAFRSGGAQLASGGADNVIRLWDVATGDCLSILNGHTGSVEAAAFASHRSLLASAGDDLTVRVWDLARLPAVLTLEGHSSSVEAVTFARRGPLLASGDRDGTVRLWEVIEGRNLRTLEGHTSPVRAVAFAADGSQLASGDDDGTVRVWDVATGGHLGTLEGHIREVGALVYAPAGFQLASASPDGTVRVWAPRRS
jgi:WD40 repeat protein